VPTPAMISTIVKILPAVLSGWSSRNPTVVIVVTVW